MHCEDHYQETGMTQKTVYNAGYIRVPGPARRYLAPSGEEISRYEYIKRTEGITPEAKRAERIEAGVKSHQGRYNAIVKDYKRTQGKDVKVRGPKAEKFKQIIKDLKSRDNSPHGKKAKALERLGRRGKDWEDYDVGESPE